MARIRIASLGFVMLQKTIKLSLFARILSIYEAYRLQMDDAKWKEGKLDAW